MQGVACAQRVAGAGDADGRVHRFSVHGDACVRRSAEDGGDAVNRKLAVAVRGCGTREVRAAELADGISYGSAGYGRTFSGLQGEGHGLCRFPLLQGVGRAQAVGRRRNLERFRRQVLAVHGDAYARIGAEGGGDVVDSECTVAVRGRRTRDVGSAKAADGVRHGCVGKILAVAFQSEGYGFCRFPLLQSIARVQVVGRGRDGEGFARRAVVVHRNFDRLRSGTDGLQSGNLELPAGVGGLRVCGEAGEAFSLGEEHAQTGHSLAVAREGEGHVRRLVLSQRIRIGSENVGRRRDGERRLGRRLAVYHDRKGLLPGKDGGQIGHGKFPAAVRGVGSARF